MSANFELRAVSRTEKGTNVSRKLRREGRVPAVVYGAGKGSQQILLDSNEISKNLGVEAFHSAIISLNTDSGEEQVILREVQMHPFRSIVMHVDFQRVKATEKLHMKVPLHFEGSDRAPGVKIDGGILSYLLKELDIKCLPKDLPEYIAVDVSNLGINESIHISQINLPGGVELTASAETGGDDPTIATITPPKIAVEEDDATDGAEIASEGAPSEGGDSIAGSTDPATQSGD
ncbi:MAG: 50S ribosomal protein L25/general stress protein Ctc [Acidiferrobacteraceae bacterium]|nr:50S ribosomal protein L25/general stress protein Ctc [Acidiferrobacteraceae bacterium]|tara:strand:- start:1201 stop:1899 length:699 start_codon:yes stop_codon:yes gene_type:complete